MSKVIPFDKKFYEKNRKKLRQDAPDLDLVIVASNGMLQKSLDAPFNFRQDSNFWYLTGINEPSVLLVLDGDNEYLILPTQSEYMLVFDGGIDKEKLRRTSGIDDVFDFQNGWEKLKKRLKQVKRVGVLKASEGYIPQLNMFVNPAKAELQGKISDINPKVELVDVKPSIINLRSVKKPEEIQAIKQATDVTVDAFIEVSRSYNRAKNEDELARVLSRTFIDKKSDHAFSPIVAGGKNATILHYNANDDKLGAEQLVLIDAGASRGYYSSDITRTFAKRPSARQIEVHTCVQEVLESAKKELRAGITLRDFENTVRKIMGDRLSRLGLIKSSDDKKYREFYPHATSHHVGLDVHDPISSDTVLEPGMVVTVEPGIYIKNEAIGVRIEDIVLITKSGIDVLSAKLPVGFDIDSKESA